MSDSSESRVRKSKRSFFSKMATDLGYRKVTSDDFLSKHADISGPVSSEIAEASRSLEAGNSTLNFVEFNDQREKDRQHKEKIEIHNARMEYAERVFELIKSWIKYVLLIVVFSGVNLRFDENWNFKALYFEISETVQVTLMTSMSVTVISMFATVLFWLFPKKDQ